MLWSGGSRGKREAISCTWVRWKMEDGRVKMEEKENQLDLRWWSLGA